MTGRVVSGDEAMACGALSAGVTFVTSYPGSPSSGTVSRLRGLTDEQDLYVEWCANEKIAMEMGIGASIGGRRALVCVKSVGMNVMVDPLMTLKLTPVHGGLVILLGDDPGGYGSQNDQDTRPLVSLLQMPMLEPATPGEAFHMMLDAFEISERYNTAVILRETRSFTHELGPIGEATVQRPTIKLGWPKTGERFVPVPSNVVTKHRAQTKRLAALAKWSEGAGYARATGTGSRGILAAGFAYTKFRDVVGDQPIHALQLGLLYPLPAAPLVAFVESCEEVMVLEENDPFIEDQIKVLAYDHQCRTRIRGKRTGDIPHEGELFRWQIRKALAEWIPDFTPARDYTESDQASEEPQRKGHCAGCRYGEIIDALEEAAKQTGESLILVGDPGCLVTVAARLDAKYGLGSAIAVADGISKVTPSKRVVALVGDSSFFHTSIPAIANAATNRSDIVIVVLDNGSAVTSGHQPHPGSPKDGSPVVQIEDVARACRIERVRTVEHTDGGDGGACLTDVFSDVLSQRTASLIRVRTDCVRHQG